MQPRILSESSNPRYVSAFIQPQRRAHSTLHHLASNLSQTGGTLNQALSSTRAISIGIGSTTPLNTVSASALPNQSLFAEFIPKDRGLLEQGHQNATQAEQQQDEKEVDKNFLSDDEIEKNYEQQQIAYLAKMRAQITPKPLSDELKESDSRKNNPLNSESARFGLKPDPKDYNFRLVSWGEAGAGIPLVNNPYSVRPQGAAAVDPNFKRKKFTTEQRDTVRNAPYRQAVQNILNAGLHNSHGLASRFLGPESSANVAPATFTNNKHKNWGQGEMQSHLEHALFRLESKASSNDLHVFLRCTDYLGTLGELRSRKIKVFLSEPVTNSADLANKGNVKETVLGTFYMPGMIKEHEDSKLMKRFKTEVSRLENSLNKVIANQTLPEGQKKPLEIHYKYGLCAQELKPLSHQKLQYGKMFRTNDGLRPVLQHNLPELSSEKQQASKKVALSQKQVSAQKNQNGIDNAIKQLKNNPYVLRSGEELWDMSEIEAVLAHIRRPDFDDYVKNLAIGDQLTWDHASVTTTQGLTRSNSHTSLNSLSTISSIGTQDEDIFQMQLEEINVDSTSNDDSSWVEINSQNSQAYGSEDDSSVASVEQKPKQKPIWSLQASDRKRRANSNQKN